MATGSRVVLLWGYAKQIMISFCCLGDRGIPSVKLLEENFSGCQILSASTSKNLPFLRLLSVQASDPLHVCLTPT